MTTRSTQLLIDAERLQREIHARGFSSVQEFADSVGVHRNTVGNYLSGKTTLPGALARILQALDLTPADVISLSQRRKRVPALALVDLIESLHMDVPQAALVLFGSRARGTPKRYSDYDIGIYQLQALEYPLFSRLLDRVSEWNDGALLTAQLVDLTHADVPFLSGLADDMIFLAGSHAAWCGLLEKAGMHLHE
jgi:transcriptional regulator with XRE-family HTH domain